MDDYKKQLDDLLTTTAKQNASDLHLAVGRRPTLRIDGVLVPLQKEPVMTPESAEGIISELLTPEQKAKLIICADIIEHVNDAGGLLASCNRNMDSPPV